MPPRNGHTHTHTHITDEYFYQLEKAKFFISFDVLLQQGKNKQEEEEEEEEEATQLFFSSPK